MTQFTMYVYCRNNMIGTAVSQWCGDLPVRICISASLIIKMNVLVNCVINVFQNVDTAVSQWHKSPLEMWLICQFATVSVPI